MERALGKPSDLRLHLEGIAKQQRWFVASIVIFQQSVQFLKNVDENIGESLQVEYESHENGELARIKYEVTACNAHLDETIEGLSSKRGPIVWAPARKEFVFLSSIEFGISTEIGTEHTVPIN